MELPTVSAVGGIDDGTAAVRAEPRMRIATKLVREAACVPGPRVEMAQRKPALFGNPVDIRMLESLAIGIGVI